MKNDIAIVVYDSWIHELPELRAVGLPDRHLIFEGNGLILDLLLRKQNGTTSILIGGQVLPRSDSFDAVAGIEVLMKQGHQQSCTRTNAFGEFAFHAIPNG